MSVHRVTNGQSPKNVNCRKAVCFSMNYWRAERLELLWYYDDRGDLGTTKSKFHEGNFFSSHKALTRKF